MIKIGVNVMLICYFVGSYRFLLKLGGSLMAYSLGLKSSYFEQLEWEPGTWVPNSSEIGVRPPVLEWSRNAFSRLSRNIPYIL